MRTLNQKGSAVVVLLILILLVAIGGVGYMVFTRQEDSGKKANDTATTPEISQSTDKAIGPLEISALGVKINDPDGRGLQLQAKKVCAFECDTEDTYFVGDSNSAYLDRCGYPAGVSESTADEFAESQKVAGSYRARHHKKIGDKYYYVFPGDSIQSPCGKLQGDDEKYEDEIRAYIVKNLVAL